MHSGASQVALVVKNLPGSAGDKKYMGSFPGLQRHPGGGPGNPLQYSCLENPMDREAWQGIVYKVVKSWTWLKWLNIHALKHSALVKSVSQAGTQKIWFCEFGLVRKVVLLLDSAVCALYVVTCWVNIILLPHYNYTEKVGYIPHLFMSELLWCSCD